MLSLSGKKWLVPHTPSLSLPLSQRRFWGYRGRRHTHIPLILGSVLGLLLVLQAHWWGSLDSSAPGYWSPCQPPQLCLRLDSFMKCSSNWAKPGHCLEGLSSSWILPAADLWVTPKSPLQLPCLPAGPRPALAAVTHLQWPPRSFTWWQYSILPQGVLGLPSVLS